MFLIIITDFGNVTRKVIIKFNGMNYSEWQGDATVTLLDRNLIEACVNAGFLFFEVNQQPMGVPTKAYGDPI